MVARKAVINAGVVENVIVADDDFTIEGRTLVTVPDSLPVRAGWTYVDGDFAGDRCRPIPPTTICCRGNSRRWSTISASIRQFGRR